MTRFTTFLMLAGFAVIAYGFLHIVAAFGGAAPDRAAELLTTGLVLGVAGTAVVIVGTHTATR